MVYAENFHLEQYDECQLSAHDIYWVKRDGARVLVRRAGDFLDQENLKKYPKLDFELKVDHQKITKLKDILLSLKEGLRPKDKLRLSQKLRDQWDHLFFTDESMTALEFLILGDELMCHKYSEFAKDWSSPSTMLFQRSVLIASLSMMGAVSLGYTSWSYLENMWLVNFSYSAFYHENSMRFSELDLMEERRVGKNNSIQKIDTLKSEFISLEAMMNLVFEKPDASETPKQIHLNELSDIERWFNYLQQTISWNSPLHLENNQLWKNLWIEDTHYILDKLRNISEVQTHKNEQYIEFEL
tara:strand:- start:129 stop:1025 length:897 start_codon:yes stop_codon:yes gene_type:complete